MAQRRSVHGLSLPTDIVSEHGVLLQSASTLIDHLLSLHGRLVPGRVPDHRHGVFARRALCLGDLLEATLFLCIRRKYSASFAVLRGALEHHLIDQLLFLGRRYEQEFDNVRDEQWVAMKAAREEGTSWNDVVRWQRSRSGKVTAIGTGIHVKGGKVGPRGPTLSIYYMVLQEYSPFQGRPKSQKYLVRSFTDPRTHRKIALRSRSIWEEFLSWEAIKRNLVINRFYGSRQVSQLDVHYGFLSA